MTIVSPKRVLVVSLSAPELDRLAAELARRGSLAGYVKRYVNKQRWWERNLARVPAIGSAYTRTLGRRLPPEGLAPEFVMEAGTVPDFLAAALNRVRLGPLSAGSLMGRRLLERCEREVAARGADHVDGSAAVVASYGVALPSFEAAKRRGAQRVLNYPIAHHRYQWKLFREEAQRSPEFAPALPRFGWSARYEAQMDAECDQADVILAGSSFVRDSFVSEGYPAHKIRVVPYGVDTERFSPDPAAAEPRRDRLDIVFVGQIGQRKGIGYLLQAYRKFHRPGTSLTLVGEMLPGSECYAPYRELWTHVPNLPNARIPGLLRKADVFVLPTLVEGMPLVVLEAMACGVPVIVTPHGPADIVRDGVDGFIVSAADAGALQEKLEWMRDHPEQRRQMGIAAREQAQRWSWARYARDACDAFLGPH